MNTTTWTLDPLPTSILVVSDMVYIVNLCIITGQFTNTLKSAVVNPLLTNPTLDSHILKTVGLCLIYNLYLKILKKYC